MSTPIRTTLPVLDNPMWINGMAHYSISGKWRESVDPYTGEVWARVSEGDSRDVDLAVSSARAALEEGPWSRMNGKERGRLLLELARLLRRDAIKIAEIETRDNGKLFRESLGMVEASAGWYEYFAGWADKVQGDTIPVDRSSMHVFTTREPVGVVAAITAWNSPVLMAAYKLGPGLAAGCTLVLKPAEHTSLSTLAFAKLTEEAGFPPGVVNVVTGDGLNVGEPLVSHPGVDKVSFTGSSATGVRVAIGAASHLAPVMLELGGKSPQIVFNDADLEAAENAIVAGIFSAAGQSCVAGSRLYAQKGIIEELTSRIIARANALVMGDPLLETTDLGPITFEKHLNKVIEFVEVAKNEGTLVLAGGGRSIRSDLSKGFFMEPTVLSGMGSEANVITQEIFGPVLCIQPFEDEAEAIAKGNDSKFGLAAGIWTRDIGRAHRLARAIKSGSVWVNTYRMVNHAVPFGGMKESGYGRENGADSIREFTKVKSVWVDTA